MVDDQGNLVSEMHGHPNLSDNGVPYTGKDADWSGYYDTGHPSEVIASGDEQTIMDLWNKARAAGKAINGLDIGYAQ